VSLDIARLIAFSGLNAAEIQIRQAASNISNADTPGYTRKNANQSSVVTGGVGAGVVITGISSDVDRLLLKSLIGATSDLGSANVVNNYLSQLQQLLGSAGGNSSNPNTGTSLANSLASLESALSTLAGSPSSVALQSAVVSALDDVTSQMRQTSHNIQNLRANADQDISTSVGSINKDIQQIAELNKQITQTAAAGQPTADLEDQRNMALQDISSYMDVNYFTNSSGELQLFTSTGRPLVDAAPHTLSYTPSNTVDASTVFAAGGFSPISLDGVDITSQITSGKVGALVTLRDRTLPAAQDQLDELAAELKSTINAVANKGTALPPPAALSGSTVRPDTLAATGIVRIAVVGQSGNLVSFKDIDLSQFNTVTDLAAAISGAGLTATIDADGRLSITATTAGDGISINEMTSSVGGAGFSAYFGLNDLVTGTGASDLAVRGDILHGDTPLQTSTLDASAAPAPGSQVLAPGSAIVANALRNALSGPTNFDAAGGLNATRSTFANYAAAIVSNVANKAALAAGVLTTKATAQATYADSLAAETGVNLDEETARISTLQNKYSAASQLIQVVNQMFDSLISAVHG
jgi:flagellar hook-associated protein 1